MRSVTSNLHPKRPGRREVVPLMGLRRLSAVPLGPRGGQTELFPFRIQYKAKDAQAKITLPRRGSLRLAPGFEPGAPYPSINLSATMATNMKRRYQSEYMKSCRARRLLGVCCNRTAISTKRPLRTAAETK